MTIKQIKKKFKETRERWVGVHHTAMMEKYAGSAAEELARDTMKKIVTLDQLCVDIFGCTADRL